MFVYTVYPAIPHKPRKKMTRQVEPVLRIKPVHRVEYNNDPIPTQQKYKTIVKNVSDIDLEQNNWNPIIDELYILHAQLLLLAWRQPKVVISPDYIQKYHAQLLTIKSENSKYTNIS